MCEAHGESCQRCIECENHRTNDNPDGCPGSMGECLKEAKDLPAEIYKSCPRYIEGVKLEGPIFRCEHDPRTKEAIEKNWAGVWCMPTLGGDIDCPLKKVKP